MSAGRGLLSVAGLLWLLVIAATAGVLVADTMIDWQSGLYRALMLTAGTLLVLGLAALTPQGNATIRLFGEARAELRRIFWPTRPETTRTTLMVLVVVAVLGLLLWGMDYVLGQLITLILG